MSEDCEKCEFVENKEKGIIYCSVCGTILEDNIISEEYEKRTCESDNHEIKRVGPATKTEQAGESGNYLVVKEKGYIQKRTAHSKKTKISKNFKRINDLLSSADVKSRLIEKTKIAYEQLAKIKNMQGRDLNQVIIALFYYVSRKEKSAKSFKDVAAMFPCTNERKVKRAFKVIKKDIVDYTDEDEIINIEKNYIDSYLSGKLDNDKEKVKSLSDTIIENINHNAMLEGKSPCTVAGLALMLSYILLNDNADNFEDFFSTFSTKGTLKKTFEKVKNELDKIIPSDYTEKIEVLKKRME